MTAATWRWGWYHVKLLTTCARVCVVLGGVSDAKAGGGGRFSACETAAKLLK